MGEMAHLFVIFIEGKRINEHTEGQNTFSLNTSGRKFVLKYRHFFHIEVNE
jgi:hypothetical protein